MDLYVVRHAVAYKRDANRWPDASKRPLTQEGEELFRRSAYGLLRLAPEVGAVLSSPYTRAWRTAEMLQQAGRPAPVPLEELEPDFPPHKVVNALAVYKDSGPVAVVGHRPQVHDLVSYLLAGDGASGEARRARADQKNGAAYLQFDGPPEPGAVSLRWLLTAKALRALC